MKPTPGVWGLDLGQCALKALRLQEIDGQLTATAFDYVEYPKILSQPDADPDQLTREALEQFLSRNTLRGDIVAIAVPGQSGLARFVKLPPVEEKKIADIVKFEAKQQIPFNLDEVVWDYQKIGSGDVVDGFALETEVGLFAMKRDVIKRNLDHFKEVGVEVHVIQMAPLALCNFLAYDLLNKDPNSPPGEGKQPCAVGLDIGTDSSNLVVTDGSKIIWQRPIPLGGNHFTRVLTKDMKLTFAKAEHLKRNATKSGAAELKKILTSLKPVLNDFVGEVQRSLGYFTNTHRDSQVEFMVGLGNAFRLPGMQRFLAEKLQLDVRKIEKMSRLVGDTVTSAPIYQENIHSFGVAYGLCLQGLKRARLVTNLLPGEIRIERLVRAKKPYAVAAASLLLVGLGAAAMGNYLNERPFIAPVVQQAITNSESAAGRASTALSTFNTKKTDALKEEEAVKTIIAGQAERVNWMKMLRFIGDAVPQPDGKNLPPEHRLAYWERKPNRKGTYVMSGKEAYEEFKRRLQEGLKPPMGDEAAEKDPLPPGIDDLVQFHLESFDARFCDDLPTFWKTATRGREEADVRPLEHHKKVMPEGKGWVIEISGFTYHHDKEGFIRNTLLTNLARMGITKPVAPAEGGTGGGAGGGAAGGGAGGAAGGGAGAAAGGTPAAGQPEVKPNDTKEPVVNKISHVLLFNAVTRAATDTSPFEICDKGVIDGLIGGAGGAGGAGGSGGPGGMGMGMGGGRPSPGGPGGPGMPSPGGPGGMGGGPGGAGGGRSSWVGLSSRSGGGAGGGGGMMGGGMGSGGPAMGMGGRGGPSSPGMPGRGGYPGMPGSPGGPGAPGGPGVPGGSNPGGASSTSTFGHTRTEFVILFIWKEPTPSDALRGTEESSTPAQ